MKKSLQAFIVTALAAGALLGATSTAQASEHWAYQETRVVEGQNIFVYSNSGGSRFASSWQGLIWNGDWTFYAY